MRRNFSAAAWIGFLLTFVEIGSAQSPVPNGLTSADQMTEKATAFVSTLTPEQRELAMLPLEGDERGWWSNVPAFFVPSYGLMLGELSDQQRIAFHDLLRASTSSQGYLKMAGIIRMDETLREIRDGAPPDQPGILRGASWPGPRDEEPSIPSELEAAIRVESDLIRTQLGERTDDRMRRTPAAYGTDNYFISIFGTPSLSEDWGWRIGGHHLAGNFTVSNGQVAFAPMFLGSQPLMVMSGRDAGWTPLPHEADRGLELLLSLTPEQRRIAILSPTPTYEVFAGPGRRDSLKEYEGLKASELDESQKMMLRVLVAEYVRNADFDAANEHLAAIAESGWDEIWFSWRGPWSDPDEVFYYRVHGPRILIEFSAETLNHIHIVVRDPVNDYGEDWLGTHYAEHHPHTDADIELTRQKMEILMQEYRNRQADQ